MKERRWLRRLPPLKHRPRPRPIRLLAAADAGHSSTNLSLISIENIEKDYLLGEVIVPALRGVSLKIEQGELTAIMGASGSGKSTLMNIIGCLDRPTRGRYILDGEDVSSFDDDRL